MEERQGQGSGRGRNWGLDTHGADVELEHGSARLRRRRGRFVSLAYSPVHAPAALGNRADAWGTGGGDEGACVVCDCTRQGDWIFAWLPPCHAGGQLLQALSGLVADWNKSDQPLGIWYVGSFQSVCGRRGEGRTSCVHLLYCYDFVKLRQTWKDEEAGGGRPETGMVLLEPLRHHGRSRLRFFRRELLGPNGDMVVGLPGHGLGCYGFASNCPFQSRKCGREIWRYDRAWARGPALGSGLKSSNGRFH